MASWTIMSPLSRHQHGWILEVIGQERRQRLEGMTIQGEGVILLEGWSSNMRVATAVSRKCGSWNSRMLRDNALTMQKKVKAVMHIRRPCVAVSTVRPNSIKVV